MTNIIYRQTTTPTVPSSTSAKGSPLTNLEVDGNFKSIVTDLGTKAPSDSPTFTGNVGLPATTAIGSVSGTEIGYLDGVTSGVQGQLDNKSPSASPTFTGAPVAPTASAGTNSTQIATTAFVVQAASDAALSLSIALG